MFYSSARKAANSAVNNPSESSEVKRQAREYVDNCNQGRVSATSSTNMFFRADKLCNAGMAAPSEIDKINKNRSIELSNMSRRSREWEYERVHACCVIL